MNADACAAPTTGGRIDNTSATGVPAPGAGVAYRPKVESLRKRVAVVVVAIAGAIGLPSSHGGASPKHSDAGSSECRMAFAELEALRREVSVLREVHARDTAALAALRNAPEQMRATPHLRGRIDPILRDPIR